MRLLDCADQDIDYIGGKLMEYNYSQAPRKGIGLGARAAGGGGGNGG